MQFKKRSLAHLPNCYAASPITIEGRQAYLFATDDNGPCYSFDAETFARQTVWEEPGGTMSIVPLPAHEGEFLASRRFLPGFRARQAEIVRACYQGGQWQVAPWMQLPYVHRFDILQRGGQYYFLGCILSSTEKEAADWDCPGYLAAAPMDAEFAPPVQLAVIADGMRQNHGYWRYRKNGYDCALTSCREGVFTVEPPAQAGGDWLVRKILDVLASDAALCDIDGDGVDELAVISPFHGDTFTLYRKTAAGYEAFYRHDVPMDFLHAIWGGRLGGEAVFLAGYRAKGKDLLLLRWQNGSIQTQIIESGKGPSNVAVIGNENAQQILVANRESAEAAVLYVTP